MSNTIHTASRVILATPQAIFRAFVDPEAMVRWRAPSRMSARLSNFDPRVGGGYRMTLVYEGEGKGKTDAKRDVVSVRFLELVADQSIVEAVEFASEDPTFQGTMTLTTTLHSLTDGTKVTFKAENVPPGISEADHRQGMQSALQNLAALLE